MPAGYDRPEIRECFWHCLTLETDDCILWPFHLDGDGYPKFWFEGGKKYVCREILKQKTGEDPPDRKAAHSCKIKKCINHRHLSWKTVRENNFDDKIRDGTLLSKLTEDHVHWIRHQLELGHGFTEIGRAIEVSPQLIYAMKVGRLHQWLPVQNPYIKLWKDLDD